jgi:hypothetical protein
LANQQFENIEGAGANTQGNAVFEDIPEFQGHGSLTETYHLIHAVLRVDSHALNSPTVTQRLSLAWPYNAADPFLVSAHLISKKR